MALETPAAQESLVSPEPEVSPVAPETLVLKAKLVHLAPLARTAAPDLPVPREPAASLA